MTPARRRKLLREAPDADVMRLVLTECRSRISGRATGGGSIPMPTTLELAELARCARGADDRYVGVQLSWRERRLIRWAITQCMASLHLIREPGAE